MGGCISNLVASFQTLQHKSVPLILFERALFSPFFDVAFIGVSSLTHIITLIFFFASDSLHSKFAIKNEV